ncbi:hypothetical protein SECTIM467_100 [Brevibacillus phage SecTim467]|uniref:Uncharacterized protein n=2 Tax=Jenstvirus jenst TaxID=1982225 RepID=A0A0K2CNU1_9CAUD|nr:hypothetical protein AVV11_gp096 [Brevibacillus phage Jenst]ALA07224.1 hypothetical protein JENST_95 [Brevibacillus phage Jenst]ALA07441.1 hypothetical protein SECTIM467_100 [Brevibacillus phage SecTim467]
MRDIIMKSPLYEVIGIKKKTRARFFEDVEVGDKVQFSMTMRHAGRASGGGVYASDVKAMNLTKGTYAIKSQSEAANIIERTFELKVVGEE